MGYRLLHRATEYCSDADETSHPDLFHLRSSADLDYVVDGHSLFITPCPETAIESFVPRKCDQLQLTKKQQSWLLVGIPDAPDYATYAWAALKPPRTILWERYAQESSDGYYAPPGFIPRNPEPGKYYHRRPGSDFLSCHHHPSNSKQLRVLVRLTDVLSEAAVDTTQYWFFVDLPMPYGPPTDTVGDMLLFAAKLVSNRGLPAEYSPQRRFAQFTFVEVQDTVTPLVEPSPH